MPPSPVEFEIGTVRLGLLALPRGEPAAPAARGWLSTVLGHPAQELAQVREPHGRPVLGIPGWDANWSHSGERLLVAVARGLRLGVDMERPRPRPRALELARRWFDPAEAAALAALQGPVREAAFLRLWCAKEAVLKAHGRGLAFGLDRLRIDGFDAPGRALALHSADAGLAPVAAWTLVDVPVDDAIAVLAWRTRAD